MAFIILKKDAAAKWAGRHDEFEGELKKHARQRLPGFACPEGVQVVEELPVSAFLLMLCGRVLMWAGRKRRRARYRRSCCARWLRSCRTTIEDRNCSPLDLTKH